MREDRGRFQFRKAKHGFKRLATLGWLLNQISQIIQGAEEPALRKALEEYASYHLSNLIKELRERVEYYKRLPLVIKAEEEIEAARWWENGDGSKYTKGVNAPNLYRLLRLKGGKAVLGRYRLYLTRSGYIKLYTGGGQHGATANH